MMYESNASIINCRKLLMEAFMKLHPPFLDKLKNYKQSFRLLFLLIGAFFTGTIIAMIQTHLTSSTKNSCPTNHILLPEENWGLSFQDERKTPIGNSSPEELKQFDAYYVGNPDEKTIYLTFDAGYENGNLPKILDTLKQHHTPATFFVVGTFVESNPELVKRMVLEGHAVGNHTWSHPDMSKISSTEDFFAELDSVEKKFNEITGAKMQKYYRPPQGKYSESNLQMAKDFGYHTFFWSLAHVDWQQDNQPSKEDAFDKLIGRIHPGAIVLLHTTSQTNAEILDELITKWESMGYTIKPLEHLIQNS